MKKITIYELMPLLKKGWVAMDEDGDWFWFDMEPYILGREWWNQGVVVCCLSCFNLKRFDGDWKKSLIRVGGKTKKKKKLFLDDLTDSELHSLSEAYN